MATTRKHFHKILTLSAQPLPKPKERSSPSPDDCTDTQTRPHKIADTLGKRRGVSRQ